MEPYLCIPFNELSLQQLYDILQLRQEVFVVEQDCPYLDADGLDQKAWHFMRYEGKKLVAYTRLLPAGVAYSDYAAIGRVITSSTVRGKGYGRHLMLASIQQTKTLFPEAPIKIGAQCYLLKFYQSLGFAPVGEEYLEDGIPHTAMILWEE